MNFSSLLPISCLGCRYKIKTAVERLRTVECETSGADRGCFGQASRFGYGTAPRDRAGFDLHAARAGDALLFAWAALTAALFSICLSSATKRNRSPSPSENKLPTTHKRAKRTALATIKQTRLSRSSAGVITTSIPTSAPDMLLSSFTMPRQCLFPTDCQDGAPLWRDLGGRSGRHRPRCFGPIVLNPRIRILGHAPLPPNPATRKPCILKTGAYDAQWVEVEGLHPRVIEYPASWCCTWSCPMDHPRCPAQRSGRNVLQPRRRPGPASCQRRPK